jgi:hypothetical protein
MTENEAKTMIVIDRLTIVGRNRRNIRHLHDAVYKD